jgi:conjugative relaxase-like TrwC/TraI family protein
VIRAVAGFDATLSAPKSLSVWWALTGDPGLAEAHDTAVHAVVEYVERFGSSTRVRSSGTRLHPDSGGLIAAVFRQTTSRLDDPQLHTHLVISSKVRTDDGSWLALDARVLKQHQRAFGGLYQSVLRAELTNRFGVAFADIVRGQAEIAGVPPELLTAFSKRAAQVSGGLQGSGWRWSQRCNVSVVQVATPVPRKSLSLVQTPAVRARALATTGQSLGSRRERSRDSSSSAA